MSTRLKKHRIIGYTGGGDYKNNHWPHPVNETFNNDVRNLVNIYGIGARNDRTLLKECREYLISRIEMLVDHKVRRDTEEYYRVMKLQIKHGIGETEEAQQKMIQEAGLLLCVGEWQQDQEALQQYKFGRMLNKPIYEMYYNGAIPIQNIHRYLQPIRPIKDVEWDPSKQENILVFETKDGILELMDGNHRHEFANRVGGVTSLSGWIIKQV